jgi:hypothetical protein
MVSFLVRTQLPSVLAEQELLHPHATGSTNSGFGIFILTTIQVCTVDWTFHGIYAGLFEGVRILEDLNYCGQRVQLLHDPRAHSRQLAPVPD